MAPAPRPTHETTSERRTHGFCGCSLLSAVEPGHAQDRAHSAAVTGPVAPRTVRRSVAAGLQLVHLRIQKLGLHQEFADLGLQPV